MGVVSVVEHCMTSVPCRCARPSALAFRRRASAIYLPAPLGPRISDSGGGLAMAGTSSRRAAGMLSVSDRTRAAVLIIALGSRLAAEVLRRDPATSSSGSPAASKSEGIVPRLYRRCWGATSSQWVGWSMRRACWSGGGKLHKGASAPQGGPRSSSCSGSAVRTGQLHPRRTLAGRAVASWVPAVRHSALSAAAAAGRLTDGDHRAAGDDGSPLAARPEIATEIKRRLFVLGSITMLGDRSIDRVLREIAGGDVTRALRSARRGVWRMHLARGSRRATIALSAPPDAAR